MKMKIQAGAELETATPHEVKGMIDDSQQSWFAEMARGVKPFRLSIAGQVSGGVFTPAGGVRPGPAQGFVWAVQRLSVDGLASNDTLKVYRDPANASTYLGQLTATAPALFTGQLGIILRGGETLAVTGSSLSQNGEYLTVTGEVLELPEFMLWKLL